MDVFFAYATILFNSFAPIVIVIAIVLLVTRRIELDARIFSRSIIYIFGPSLTFNTLINTQVSLSEIGRVFLAVIFGGLLMVGLAAAVAYGMRLPRRMATTFVLTAMVMNAVNLGFPFIEFTFGSEALDRAIIFSVGQVIMVYGLGTFVVSLGTRSPRDSLGNVLRIPMPYVFILAILFNYNGWSVPVPIERAVSTLGAATVPCALIILGLQLRSARLNGRWPPLLAIIITRFGGGALVAFLMASLFSLSDLTRQVFILEFSMPVGVASGVLATEFDGDAEFAAAAVFLSTAICLLPLGTLLFVLL